MIPTYHPLAASLRQQQVRRNTEAPHRHHRLRKHQQMDSPTIIRQPSQERGCDDKTNLGRKYKKSADKLAARHGKQLQWIGHNRRKTGRMVYR
jgi:hypothetical protein